MGFITKNYYKEDFDFLRHYGFTYYYSNECWTITETYGFDEITVSITNNGEDVEVSVGDRNFTSFTKRYAFKMNAENVDEKDYIDELDEKVTTFLEEQGYDAFHNIDNRYRE